MPIATELPAILGGNQAITLDQDEANKWPIISTHDEQAVLDVLRSGDLSLHPIIGELEELLYQRLDIDLDLMFATPPNSLRTACRI